MPILTWIQEYAFESTILRSLLENAHGGIVLVGLERWQPA